MKLTNAQRIEKANSRINELREKRNSSGAARGIWLRHLIKKNERRLDRLLEMELGSNYMNEAKGIIGDQETALKGMERIADRDMRKAWEAAEAKADSISNTTGKTVDVKDVLEVPESVSLYSTKLAQMAVQKMKAKGGKAQFRAQNSSKRIRAEHVMNLVFSPIVGAVTGFFMAPSSIWGPAIGAVVALCCMVAMVATDRWQ